MHILCVYAVKLLSGFFWLFWDRVMAFFGEALMWLIAIPVVACPAVGCECDVAELKSSLLHCKCK